MFRQLPRMLSVGYDPQSRWPLMIQVSCLEFILIRIKLFLFWFLLFIFLFLCFYIFCTRFCFCDNHKMGCYCLSIYFSLSLPMTLNYFIIGPKASTMCVRNVSFPDILGCIHFNEVKILLVWDKRHAIFLICVGIFVL